MNKNCPYELCRRIRAVRVKTTMKRAMDTLYHLDKRLTYERLQLSHTYKP